MRTLFTAIAFLFATLAFGADTDVRIIAPDGHALTEQEMRYLKECSEKAIHYSETLSYAVSKGDAMAGWTVAVMAATCLSESQRQATEDRQSPPTANSNENFVKECSLRGTGSVLFDLALSKRIAQCGSTVDYMRASCTRMTIRNACLAEAVRIQKRGVLDLENKSRDSGGNKLPKTLM